MACAALRRATRNNFSTRIGDSMVSEVLPGGGLRVDDSVQWKGGRLNTLTASRETRFGVVLKRGINICKLSAGNSCYLCVRKKLIIVFITMRKCAIKYVMFIFKQSLWFQIAFSQTELRHVWQTNVGIVYWFFLCNL